MDGRNKYEKELDSEFEFIYRHKRKAAASSEAKEAEKQAAETDTEVKSPIEEATGASEKSKPKTAVKKKKPTDKKAKVKKPVKPTESTEVAKERPKIHPKYGAPYKNDSQKHRKRPPSKKPKTRYDKELTEEQNRRNIEFRMEKRRRMIARAKNVFLILLASVLLASVLFLTSFGAFHVLFSLPAVGFDSGELEYCVGPSDNTKTVSTEDYSRNGELYVSMADLVKLCGFTVTGTDDEIKYISPDEGNESVMFVVGTTIAYVNKVKLELRSPTFRDGGVLYVPYSFLYDYSTGLICTYEPETEEDPAKLTVRKELENERDVLTYGAEPIYAPVAFRIKSPTVLGSLPEEALKQELPEPEYTIDIEPFREYINPENMLEFIQVVNSDNPLYGTVVYDDLTNVVSQTVTIDEPIKIRKYAAKALEAMILEAKANKVTRYAVFRGYETEETSPFDDPLLDENLLGLSVDLYFGKKELSYGESDVFYWFRDNAHKFGFIVRYPEDKTGSTGVEFRPWTLRYVGRYNATKMYNENLSLEEYITKYRLEGFVYSEH